MRVAKLKIRGEAANFGALFIKRGEILNDKNDVKRIEKIFPDYFQRFQLPEGAREESIKVYRACRSGRCDKASFLPSFEERGFVLDPMVAQRTLGNTLYRPLKNPRM